VGRIIEPHVGGGVEYANNAIGDSDGESVPWAEMGETPSDRFALRIEIRTT
jgi:hypothetical protein